MVDDVYKLLAWDNRKHFQIPLQNGTFTTPKYHNHQTKNAPKILTICVEVLLKYGRSFHQFSGCYKRVCGRLLGKWHTSSSWRRSRSDTLGNKQEDIRIDYGERIVWTTGVY